MLFLLLIDSFSSTDFLLFCFVDIFGHVWCLNGTNKLISVRFCCLAKTPQKYKNAKCTNVIQIATQVFNLYLFHYLCVQPVIKVHLVTRLGGTWHEYSPYQQTLTLKQTHTLPTHTHMHWWNQLWYLTNGAYEEHQYQ